MIQIIKSGNSATKYICCKHCKCYFTATEADMSEEEEYGRFFYYIDCPECRRQLTINEQQLSTGYQNILKRDLGLIKTEFNDEVYCS